MFNKNRADAGGGGFQNASLPMAQLKDNDQVESVQNSQAFRDLLQGQYKVSQPKTIGIVGSGPVSKRPIDKNEEVSDEDDCADTDEHIIHAAAKFNPSGMMSASDSGATSSQHTFENAGISIEKVTVATGSQQQLQQSNMYHASQGQHEL